MNKQQEALKLALEAMTYADACLKKQLTTKDKHQYAQDLLLEAGTAIREALAEQPAQQQEPSMAYRVQMCPRQDCATARKCTSFAACSTRAHIKPEKPTCKDCLHDEQPAQPLTDEQITAGARALCQQMAEACNVDAGDQWQLYADTFKEDAKAVLTAAAKLREKNA